jgi:hypothetical protein
VGKKLPAEKRDLSSPIFIMSDCARAEPAPTTARDKNTAARVFVASLRLSYGYHSVI